MLEKANHINEILKRNAAVEHEVNTGNH